MQGQAYIFINYLQAGGLGHIGWGFTVGDGRHYFGAVDHLWGQDSMLSLRAWLRYSRVLSGENIDWWGKVGSEEEMLEAMRAGHHIKYHDFKVLSVESAQPELAIKEAEAIEGAGWHVLTSNCVHQTYRVLSSYGAACLLPPPVVPIPRIWFNFIASPPQFLRPANQL